MINPTTEDIVKEVELTLLELDCIRGYLNQVTGVNKFVTNRALVKVNKIEIGLRHILFHYYIHN